MTIHVCFKCMFQMFHLFQTYVANVLFGCYKSRSRCCIYICKCFRCFFIRILQMLHLNVCNGYTRVYKFFWCFISVLNICCKYFNCFGRMLQVFHLDVAKVDQMLHMSWGATVGHRAVGAEPGIEYRGAMYKTKLVNYTKLYHIYNSNICFTGLN
jgi:hypothetical protein